ncbi:hypothetical protein [Streptomyces hypolithicus]
MITNLVRGLAALSLSLAPLIVPSPAQAGESREGYTRRTPPRPSPPWRRPRSP